MHNCKVIRNGSGELLVTYRPTYAVDYHDYVPCDACYAYIQKSELWRHRCKLKSKTKGRVAANAALLLPAQAGMSSRVHRLVEGMLNPDVKLIIRNDNVVNSYAQKLVHKHSMSKKAYIRGQLNLLARFLQEMRKSCRSVTLKDCICPAQLKNVVKAVRSLAGFSDDSGLYRIPSSALKLGHMLKKCAKIVKTDAIKTNSRNDMENAEFFKQLCETEWSGEVSAKALQTLVTKRRNKVKLLPLSEDVTKLHSYLNKEMTTSMSVLQNRPEAESTSGDLGKAWRRLASATLAQLITFNRRRSGEVSRMTLHDFQSRKKSAVSSDSQKALGTLEQSLCKMFARIEVEGKRGRTVPKLLKKEAESALQLLENTRQQYGVKVDNQYMFAVSHSDSY